jgi:hypothetical protein
MNKNFKGTRVAYALAKTTKGGKGKIKSRPGYKKHSKIGYIKQTNSFKSRIVHALAAITPGGKGRIKKRPSYKKHIK